MTLQFYNREYILIDSHWRVLFAGKQITPIRDFLFKTFLSSDFFKTDYSNKNGEVRTRQIYLKAHKTKHAQVY